MPNAAATVLPWKRLPSVSEQITRSRISRSPAPNADSSRGPARTATTRPSPVRVTRSGHGSGMPGSCWSFMQASIPGEGHNRLTSRPHRGISFPSSQGVPARPRRLVAARSGTGEADRADPDLRARLDCRDLDIGHVAANPQVRPRIQSTATGDLGLAAAAVGLAAFCVVVTDVGWQVARHGAVMAHEGAHAMADSLLGRQVD